MYIYIYIERERDVYVCMYKYLCIYIYIYICLLHMWGHTGVCENNTPSEKTTPRDVGSQSTKSGTGEQPLPLDRMTEARL